MTRKLKRAEFWLRRRSHLPVFVVGAVVVLLLFFNEETSISLNMEYERQINDLRREIQLCRDSAEYYRRKREAILSDNNDLEHVAREQYHMQRPSEDVYLVR